MTATHPIRSTCPYCGVGCGVLIRRETDNAVTIKGDPEHPANFGRLCSKGSALGDTLSLHGRLLYPHIGDRQTDWGEALDLVAGKFAKTIAEHGPDSVAFYVSGQLLTEDYYVANKLMKGFIGSGNIDTNSRLCMSSSVAGHKRAFGEDIVPGCYEDLELADLIVLVGSNTAWCHPVLYQRMVAAKKARPQLKVITIDPRRTATCDISDLHLALQPGTDVLLFNGLLTWLRRNDRLDYSFLEHHVSGYAAALAAAESSSPSIPEVAKGCGLSEAEVSSFFHWFANTEKTVTAWSQGVNQSSSGSDKVNAIINVHLATGRIGKPGMGPFSLTGQPNAMGGREVGGLANQLAAHMDFDKADHRQTVSRFWDAPNLAQRPGLKAVELFEAMAQGRIKAIWIMATNPAVSLPDSNAVRQALQRCEFVVVSDCEDNTDLMPYAHVRLPALGWGEKDGTVTNSERRISRQRAFLPPPGQAQPDWWIIKEVAQRMGFANAFRYQKCSEVFREHAQLSAFQNEAQRLFDIGGLSDLTDSDYDQLAPVQWPAPVTLKTSDQAPERPVHGNRADAARARLFSDGRFGYPDGKARMLPLSLRPPVNGTTREFPLVLNTGRIRDQWHTMTRTARSPRLNQHISEPFAELHPQDAGPADVQHGALARLRSPWGTALARIRVTESQRPGSVFMPMHWNDRFARQGLANALVNPVVDPVSGEPESKHTPVTVEPFQARWHGFLIAQRPIDIADANWCVAVPGDGCWLYELAGEVLPESWTNWAREHLDEHADEDEWLEFSDPSVGRYRSAVLRHGKLQSCLFISPTIELPPRSWLLGLFNRNELPENSRMSLLTGRPPSTEADQGRIVCACFSVGLKTLQRAIQLQGLTTAEQIGASLKAGTNCGSCIPELKAILQESRSG